VGRRPSTRVDNKSPQMTDALINAHATRPLVRARCHHVCAAITAPSCPVRQLPWLRTRRRGDASGTVGSGADANVATDAGAVDVTTGSGTVSTAPLAPRPSWLTPTNVAAPTTATTSAATYFAFAPGILIGHSFAAEHDEMMKTEPPVSEAAQQLGLLELELVLGEGAGLAQTVELLDLVRDRMGRRGRWLRLLHAGGDRGAEA